MKHRHAFLYDFFATAAKAAFAVLCLAGASSIFVKLIDHDPDVAFLVRSLIFILGGLTITAFLFGVAYFCAKQQDQDDLNQQ
jgi:hypothetical protein